MKRGLIICALALFTAGIMSAQELPQPADTTAQGKELKEQKQNQEQNGTQNQEQEKTQTQAQKGNSSAVKQVKSARPDWTKVRGARPASVERPSGSKIPKGVGRPGGAKGPGKR